MKKKLSEIFDEVKPNELDPFSDGLDAPVLSPETLSSVKDKVFAKTGLKVSAKSRKNLWLRFIAAAACLCLIVSVVIVIPLLRKDVPGTIPNPNATEDNNGPDIPSVNVQAPSPAPQYYGSASGTGMSALLNSTGLSVTAQLVETLPDTYTFYNDGRQSEFCLLRMKTVKLLKGQEMTDEFYYLIPVGFMTDFSLFDNFVILDMAQLWYEYAIVYNKTQGRPERIDLALFCYRTGYDDMGQEFMAFDAEGNFDIRLWEANEKWISQTESAQTVTTLQQTEEKEQQESWGDNLYVHLLKDITGEAKEVLAQVVSFENGIYVPSISDTILYNSPEVQFHAVRYVNGFATNEMVSIWCKEWSGGEADTFSFTKARFKQEELNTLPDLSSAMTSVAAAYEGGEITPPHIINYEELTLSTYGIFGWYAKTADGIVGIVKVTWNYRSGETDDAYYIVEHGSDACKAIDRDALLEKLGQYEKTYIYQGKYDENGKVRRGIYPLP